MNDQLVIGSKASFDDFEASLKSRKLARPKKKIIKETVPYSNIAYDFSAINGEVYWEERELEFVFEIIAPTPERLEELETNFSNWVMNVRNEQIHDPFTPDHHYIGTFADIDFEDEETLDKTTVTVTFTAYPYKIANAPTEIYGRGEKGGVLYYLVVENRSAHRVKATARFRRDKISEDQGGPYRFYLANDRETEYQDIGYDAGTDFYLPADVNTIVYYSTGVRDGAFTFTVQFTEEVF